MPRGARQWDGKAEAADLFEYVPPEPAAAPAERQARGGITDAEARVKAKAVERFLFWFLSTTIKQLEKADSAALARKHPPLEPDDIGQMIDVRLRALRRKAKKGDQPEASGTRSKRV